ncbi:hypothetical protein OAB57_02925 [Bacteriovoracaceae bacterium]|nr:hypothetical protein [Bacteriovoracaceae bacterium]
MRMTKDKYQETLSLIGLNPNGFANQFYGHMFSQNEVFEETFRNSDMRLQKVELVKGFLMIFSLLEDQDKLEEFLVDLGIRHVCYEVLPEFYQDIKVTLYKSIRNLHGDSWTEDLDVSWSELIDFITQKMLDGTNQITVNRM